MGNLNERINKVMTEAGLSAYRIGLDTPVTGEAVKRVQNGKTKDPQISTLMAIAQATGHTVSELIGEKERPVQIPRAPCTWGDLRMCLEELGIRGESADVAMRMLRPLADPKKAQKDQGKRAATG